MKRTCVRAALQPSSQSWAKKKILSFAKTDSTLDNALLRLDSVKGDRAGKLRITHLQQEALPGDDKFARQRTFLF